MGSDMVLDLDSTAAFRFLNEATAAGAKARWVQSKERSRVQFSNLDRALIKRLIEGTGLCLQEASPAVNDESPQDSAKEDADEHLMFASPRVAILQTYPESMDGGWTRLVLEEHRFLTTIVHPGDLQDESFLSRFDTLVLPSASTNAYVKGGSSPLPHPFDQALGQRGVASIQEFVNSGGRLVALDSAVPLALDIVESAHAESEKRKRSETPDWHSEVLKTVTVPGSLLRGQLCDSVGSWTRGLPESFDFYASSARVLRMPGKVGHWTWSGSAHFGFVGPHLRSGYLDGGEALSGQPILAQISLGSGRVTVFAFRPQHRSQTLGTMPLLFRSLINDPIAN
jgi:hypothetical protein